jgi:hypothetical protein
MSAGTAYRIPGNSSPCVSAASTQYYQETHETHETAVIRVQEGDQQAKLVLQVGPWLTSGDTGLRE